MSPRRLVSIGAAIALVALTACDDDDGRPPFEVTSTAFGHEETIPLRHTCDGDDISPPLLFEEFPDETVSFAVIMDEPDAPGGRFTHWLLWGIPAQHVFLGEDVAKIENPASGMTQGTNDAETIGYSGPCPGDEDSDEHRYVFRVYALDRVPAVAAGANRAAVDKAIEGHIVGKGKLVGYYERED